MKQKRTVGISPKYMKARTIFPIVSMVLIVSIVAGLYLHFSWNRYSRMAKEEALQLAQSVESLLHPEHLAALALDESQAASDAASVEQSLERLVEANDSIYYAYILKQKNGSIVVMADSSAADSLTSNPTKSSCEETAEINQVPFETGQSLLTEPISLPCGTWIRALVPVKNPENGDIIATLGLSYSASEWQAQLREKMVPDIMVVSCLFALVFMLLNLVQKNAKLERAEKLRQESARSQSVFFSHLPGMAYRCRLDPNWTMEFVSGGCEELTGYTSEALIENREISYAEIIAPEHRDSVQAEWERVLIQHGRYRGEYEILTKSNER